MLSKKVQGSGMLTVAAGIDRGRVGERLQAALAGLQELHFLKEKQAGMVHWALRMDREEPMDSCPLNINQVPVYAEEQRLEATLTALKQQLTRLRRQDVGLKTHLQQLDQQISELKLDVCKASTEHLESDSRPSSGFYELSDGGSGSLSNSCTSVYSACLSTSSQTNLHHHQSLLHHHPPLPPAQPHPSAKPGAAAAALDASRRRSADDPTAHAAAAEPPRGSGIRLGSSRIRTGVPGAERGRQRPVSTGDLDRMIIPGVAYGKPESRPSPLCGGNLRGGANVDSKFQSNLVSRSGAEMYRYPSPLHAVALQSPIFYLSPNSNNNPTSASLPLDNQGPQEGTTATANGLVDAELVGTKAAEAANAAGTAQIRPVGYIHKILQRSTSKLNILTESGPCTTTALPAGPLSTGTPHSLWISAASQEVDSSSISSSSSQSVKMQSPIFFQENTMLPDQYKNAKMYHNQNVGNGGPTSLGLNSNAHDTPQLGPSDHTSFTRESKTNRTVSKHAETAEALAKYETPGNTCERSNGHETRKRSSSKPPERRPKVAPAAGEDQFVHAQFVPAGTQQVKVLQADRKTKAIRLRRRSCDKPRGSSKHSQKLSSRDRDRDREKEREVSAKVRGDRRSSNVERGLAIHNCSEFNMPGHFPACCSGGQPVVPNNQAIKYGKTCQPHTQSSPDRSTERRRQFAQKGLSASEARLSQCVSSSQRAKEAFVQGSGRRSGTRPLSGHWGGSGASGTAAGAPRPCLRPSMSASSYFNQMNARYPPAPAPAPSRRGPLCSSSSSRYPARCDSVMSEYSAECASLFHSTIAESSEGELSDYTANRFGDSESSQASSQTHTDDSDSSLSLYEDELEEVEEEDEEEEEGGGVDSGLVWAEAALGPTAAGLPLTQASQPEPLACRIKASRALKKKIRRFQPDSLKVMTLV